MPILRITISRRKAPVSMLRRAAVCAAVNATGMDAKMFVPMILVAETESPFMLVEVLALAKEERNADWFQRLARAVGEVAHAYDTEADLDVFTFQQDENVGFYSVAGEKPSSE